MPTHALLVLAVAVPVLLSGPPRLTVAAGAPGAPLLVTAEHLGGADHLVVSARAIHLDNGRPLERSARVVETTSPGPNRRAFLLTPPRTPGVPQVLVVRGRHGAGEDAPFMEALVRIDGAGAVVGIEYPQRTSLSGGSRSPAVRDEQILSALNAMGAR